MSPKFLLLLLLPFFTQVLHATPPAEDGKAIFTTRCAACHNINKQLTGPALAGVHERRSIDWIISFIHSSQGMVKKGDKEAIAIFEKFNKIPMPDHTDLSDVDIQSIVEYIKSESKPVLATKAPFVKPGKLKPNYLPLSIQIDYKFFVGYLSAVMLLIFVLLFAVSVYNTKQEC